MATCAVLCGHLLIPVDEVCSLRASRDPLLTPLLFEARTGLAWKRIMEWAHFSERFLHPYPCATFWLSISVSFVCVFSNLPGLIIANSERALPHHIPVLTAHR